MTEPRVLQVVCSVHGVIRVRTLDGRAHTDQVFCTWIVSFGDVCGQHCTIRSDRTETSERENGGSAPEGN